MANRYWVGGTATWDGTVGLKWALTSGGVGGQLAPTTSDTVFFDANSGANTVTIGTGAVCSTLTMTGFTGTLAFGTNTISTAGTGTVYVGATTFSVTGTPLINLTNSSSSNRTINAGATTEANSISFNISAGSGSTTITASTCVKSLIFSGSYTGAHVSSAYTIYGNLTFKSGMTITAGTSIRTFAATSGTQQITSATLNLDFPITFSGTATYQLQDNLSVGTSTSRTITLTSGTLDLNNFTLTNFGIFSSSNSNTRAIAFGSSGVINNTRTGSATFWACATITNFARTGTPSVKFTGNATTLTVQHGTTAGGSEDNSMSFAFGSNPTIVLASTNWILDLELLSGSSITLSGGATGRTIYGGYKGATNPFGNITFASTNATTRDIYLGSTSAGLYYFTFDGAGGSWQLSADSFIEYIILYRGSFSTNGYTLNVHTLGFLNTATKTLTINSTVNLYQTASVGGSIGGNATGTTANLSGSIIRYIDSGIFYATGFTFPSVVYDGATGGSITFQYPTASVTSLTTNSACSIIIEPDATLNIVNLSLYGDATNHGKITSNVSGSQGYISKSSGTVTVSYQDIDNNQAIGGAVWLAPTTNGNVDGGNNSGWIFGTVVQKLLTVLSSSTITLNKNTQKYLNIVSNSTITLLINRIISVILTVFSYISFGALNSFAINNNAINNASTTNGVISTNTIINKINKTFSYVSSVASSLTNSSVFLRLLSVVAASTNTILKAIQTTKTVVTSSTASVLKVVGKVVSYVSTSTNSLIPSRAYLRLLSVTSTSTATMFKLVGKTITALCVSVVLFIKVVGKKATASVSSTATLLYGFFIGRLLTVSVSTTNTVSKLLTLTKTILATVASTATIQKDRAKILLAISTTNSFVTTVTARFVLLVTTVYTSVVSHFYKVLLNIEDTIIVPTKKVIVQVFVGFTDILVKPKKTNIVVTKQDDVNG